MKKNILVLICAAVFSLGLNAQSATELSGEWLFSAVHNPGSEMDAATVASAAETLQGTTFTFDKSGMYKSKLNGERDGGSFEMQGENILLAMENGTELNLEIISYSGNEIVVRLKDLAGEAITKSMVFERK